MNRVLLLKKCVNALRILNQNLDHNENESVTLFPWWYLWNYTTYRWWEQKRVELCWIYSMSVSAPLTDNVGAVWKPAKPGALSNSVMVLVGLVYSGVIMGRSGIGSGGGNCLMVFVRLVRSLGANEWQGRPYRVKYGPSKSVGHAVAGDAVEEDEAEFEFKDE